MSKIILFGMTSEDDNYFGEKMISDVHSLAMLQFEERQFQHFKLEENIRLELLDYVNTLSKAYSSIAEPPAVITFGGPEGEVRSRGEKIQNNSIANGESNLFSSDELTEDTVVGNVLLKLIKECLILLT